MGETSTSAPTAVTALTPGVGTAAAPVDPDHVIVLRDGKFDDTSRAQLDGLFDRYQQVAPTTPLVLHFHGGLVKKASGLEIARRLTPVYVQAGGYPAFVVWESGLFEVVEHNLPEIFGESLFKRVLALVGKRVAQRALESVGVGVAGVSPATAAAVISAVSAAESKLATPTLTGEEMAAALMVLPDELPPDASVSSREEESFAREVEQDPEVQRVVQAIAAEKSLPQAAAVGTAGVGTAGGRSAAPATVRVRVSKHTLMSPDVVAAIRVAPGVQPAGVLSLGRVALGAAKVLVRVVMRFARHRSHGAHATIVEEILRELYAANAAEGVWSLMKQDTADAFAGPGERFGGTAILERIVRLAGAGQSLPRLVLVGHSAGAVYICNFLRHADAALRRAGGAAAGLQFDVVLLAPACTFRLFDRVLTDHGHRIRALRILAMADEAERADQLIDADDHPQVDAAARLLYPSSLLYFVSGVCEADTDFRGDAPLLGMERFHKPQRPFVGPDFPEIARVRQFLAKAPGRVVFGPTGGDAPAGRRTTAVDHGDFDNDGPTLASVSAVIASGTQLAAAESAAGGGVTTATLPLPGFPAGATGEGRGTAPVPDGEEYTGRQLVRMVPGELDAGLRAMHDRVGLAAVLADQPGTVDQIVGGGAYAAVFPTIGVAVINADPDALARIEKVALAGGTPLTKVVRERRIYLASERDFADGFLAGASALAEAARRRGQPPVPGAAAAGLLPPAQAQLHGPGEWDENRASWALYATGVVGSGFDGAGSRIAILDTGFDPSVGDFATAGSARAITVQSFVGGDGRDTRGHGTQCTGIAGGPIAPRSGVRYGVAPAADLFVAKVMPDSGGGTEADVYAGLEWALGHQCHVVSISLVFPPSRSGVDLEADRLFSDVVTRALGLGTIVVGAVGNDTVDPGRRQPVRRPAEFESVVAVGAVDRVPRDSRSAGGAARVFEPALFSNGDVGGTGRGVNIAAPGVDVLSSFHLAPYSRVDAGTSFATPLVAGVAALWAQARNARGTALRDVLYETALRLPPHPAAVVGHGMVQAPRR